MRYDDERHGSVRGYRMGCRCDPCRESKSEQNRARLRALEAKDPIALTGGRWVPCDGIMRWEVAL